MPATIQSKPFDIQWARKETIACEEIIHFNNAGASLMPVPVSEALHNYLTSEEYIGGYETEAKFGRLMDISLRMVVMSC